MIDWASKFCNMAFEKGAVPEEWKTAVTVSIYRGTGERTEYKNYRGISLVSVVRKICEAFLVDEIRRVSESLTDDE